MTTSAGAQQAVDLTNCDTEPIHIPGSIQPHGLFLAIDPETSLVAVASANSLEMIGVPVEDCVGRSLADLLGHELAALVADKYRSQLLVDPEQLVIGPDSPVSVHGGSLAGRSVEVVVHRSGGAAVVELETATTSPGTAASSYRAARSVVARLSGAASVQDLCDALAHEIRAVSGFDRVMVYRFDAQWNGEVISEEKREDLNSFLGLHYPATDIPVQARALYTANWIRLIADIEYRPVLLHPDCGPTSAFPLDLSHSTLRSVSPIHIEYLHHMGVSASMSVSLVIDGQLWGLIACHHYSGPHRPSQDARSTAEFLAQTASMIISRRLETDEREETLAAQEAVGRLSAALANDSRPPSAVLADHATDLLGLLDAATCAVYDGETLEIIGAPVPEGRIRTTARMLQRADGSASATNHLAALVPDAASTDLAGAVRVGLGDERWIMWMRPEFEREVDWGGDPQNQKLYSVEGEQVRLSPRRSFDKWRQVVRDHSQPWQRWEITAAERLADVVARIAARQQRERISVAEGLQRALISDEPPAVPGVEVAARYLPAAGGQLGGDWWDVLPLGAGRVALVVGDVAGHGVLASAVMAQLRLAMRAYLLEGHDAAESLQRLDTLAVSMLHGNLTTAVIAILDPATGRLEVASAGHLPPLIVTGQVAEYVTLRPRPPLGVGVDRPGTPSVLDLAPGSTLVLYTDGLVERRDLSLDEGMQTLAATSLDTSGADVGAWVDDLLARNGRALGDDTTLLAVRRSW